MSRRPILIAGAGIAGLSLALALARRGIESRIVERRDAFTEPGAGIQLGPNAMHVLAALGVAGRIAEAAGRPEAIEVCDGASGRVLARLPLGADIERRFGAPYLVVHRADLHAILVDAATQTPGIEFVTGFEVAEWAERDDGVCVSSTAGSEARGSALVGADGIWSVVRRTLFAAHPLTYAGKMAARTVIPAEATHGRFARQATGVWFGTDAHVVHYPVRRGRDIAVVAIVDAPAALEGWGSGIEGVDVRARLAGFSPELLAFLDAAREWRAWSLYDPPPLLHWSRGRICLIGDAAHPILPFLAQGGAMALEDAATLAALLAAAPHSPAQAFSRLETMRQGRLARVQAASRDNGRIFHLSGAAGLARNLALAALPGSLLMRRYDWLYGWKA